MDDESEMLLLEDVGFNDESWAEYDDESAFLGEYDDESDDEAAEDAEFIGPLLGGLAGPIVSGIGSLFGGGARPAPAPRRYNTGVPGTSVGPGVSTARLITPNGQANLQLPAAVVPRTEFLRVTNALRTAISKNTAHINTTQRDVATVRQQATAAAAAAAVLRTDLTKHKKAMLVQHKRDRRAWQRTLTKMREEQRSQAMMSMMMGMMSQRQVQDSIEEHTHNFTTTSPTAAANVDSNDNMAMMMMPMMMMGQGSGSGGGQDNSMMWMMMAMMMGNQ